MLKLYRPVVATSKYTMPVLQNIAGLYFTLIVYP